MSFLEAFRGMSLREKVGSVGLYLGSVITSGAGANLIHRPDIYNESLKVGQSAIQGLGAELALGSVIMYLLGTVMVESHVDKMYRNQSEYS